MLYLTIHSTHFILRLCGVGYMVNDHSDSTEEIRCLYYMGYSIRLSARDLLYVPPHGQPLLHLSWSMARMRNISMVHHDGLIRRPVAP